MMKKYFLGLSFFVVLATVISACSGKLRPLSSEQFTTTPQPLTLVGGQVPATVSASFPAKWFNKKAALTVTPVLRYEGGETWGPSFKYQGEKVPGNERVINYTKGDVVSMNFAFDYKPAMAKSALYLTFKATIGNKEVRLPDVKVADGVVATESWASAANVTPAIAPDAFRRVIKEAHDADIMFLIQQAEVRAKELNKTSVKDWATTVKDANETNNKKVDVELQAYASPDGGVKLNTTLSENREKNTRRAIDQRFKAEKIKGVDINAHYTAQDWDGFRQLVEKSNIQDKDLVLRVLSMYSDTETREREIKNISAVFHQLADEILPQLRRSRLIANIEIIGKSDDEIKKLATENPKQLNVEELLYAATLTDNSSEKEAVYKKVIEFFPDDFRAYNNIGMLHYEQGRLKEAAEWFARANNVKPGNAETSLNLGLLALASGKKDAAMQYFGAAASVPELKEANALLLLNQGKYADAARAFGDVKSNNAAVAQLLNNDYNSAMQTLNAIVVPNAETDYLKAVVAARTNDLNSLLKNLSAAIQKDRSLARRAGNDLEFAKYARENAFKALLNY